MDGKPCGLITMLSPALEAEWAARLPEFIEKFRPAALILQGPPTGATANLVAKAKAFSFAVLSGSIDAARETGASGVYFPGPGGDVSAARKALGAGSIIGAACGLSRHAAMESAEAGADFVAFDASSPGAFEKAAGLSSWWDEITGVPAALFCAESIPARTSLSEARPDFVILKETGLPGESLTFATELGLQSQS